MTFQANYSPNQTLPTDMEIFKEDILNEVLSIPCQKPDMDRLLKTLVDISVEGSKLIKTEKGLSNEGQNLTGYKLIVKLRIKEKVTYVADVCSKAVHAAHYENIKNIFLIVPETIDGEDINILFKRGRLAITPYIECVESRKLDARTIHKCVMFIVEVKKIN